MADRYCTADNPVSLSRDGAGKLRLDGRPYRGQRMIHEAAVPIVETFAKTHAEGPIVLMRCPHCGESFWAEATHAH